MPTNNIPVINRPLKKAKRVANPNGISPVYGLPQVNHNPTPEFGLTPLHVQKLTQGNNYYKGFNIGKPYYGHSENAKTGLKANGAQPAIRAALGALGLINIYNEEKDISRSDQPDWYREELERQKRKETGIFKKEDLFPNKYQVLANGGNLFPGGGELPQITRSGKVRDFLHKNIGIPLALNQFGYDISGGESPITEESLTDVELNNLRNIVRTNLKQNKTNIKYEDYYPNSLDEDAQLNYKGYAGNLKDAITALSLPKTNLEYLLGQAAIKINGKDTTVQDRYNFNDRLTTRELLKSIKGNTPYGIMSGIGHTFGSKEGDGSPINIKINQKKYGGNLPTIKYKYK